MKGALNYIEIIAPALNYIEIIAPVFCKAFLRTEVRGDFNIQGIKYF
jgi:hypothetical protein